MDGRIGSYVSSDHWPSIAARPYQRTTCVIQRQAWLTEESKEFLREHIMVVVVCPSTFLHCQVKLCVRSGHGPLSFGLSAGISFACLFGVAKQYPAKYRSSLRCRWSVPINRHGTGLGSWLGHLLDFRDTFGLFGVSPTTMRLPLPPTTNEGR